MKPYTAGLTDLLAHNSEADAYFRTLPPDVRTAVCDQDISTLEELKNQAERIIHAPF